VTGAGAAWRLPAPPVVRSIVAATDLTPSCDEVLRAAAALAGATAARLHVVHAFDLPATGYAEFDLSPPPFYERWLDEAVRALGAQVARTVPPDVPVASRRVYLHAAHEAILERVREVGADLVVVGAHRRRDPGASFLGTTADRVVRSSDAPCLVVRAPLALPVRRVVVPFDLSEPSRDALDLAVAWAGGLGAYDPEAGIPETELDVVHVIPDVFFPSGLSFDRAVVGPRLHDAVEAALSRSALATGLPVREEVVWGSPTAEVIVRYAREMEADVLVLATHGHGALKRALIGSVAQGVARSAPCPVALVPPELRAGSDPDG